MFCFKCGKRGKLSPKYDAYFCKRCNVWIKPRCPDRKCDFCKARPRRPIVRLALIARMKAGELTLDQVQAELRRIQRNAGKSGKITRAKAWREA